MDNNALLTYSPSPHIKTHITTRWIMIRVCIALLPACVMGVIYFGLNALLILALALFSAVASEFIYLLIAGKKIKEIAAQFDRFANNAGYGAAAQDPVCSQTERVMGLVNPAIAGRIFIFMSFQAVVGEWLLPSIGSVTGNSVTTSATILTELLNGTASQLSNWDLLLGTGMAGCIGETCKLALIIGAVYLCAMRIIDIRFPLIYIAVTGLFTVALNGFNFAYFLPSILLGGLIIGAFFMATDYVTTPNTKAGNYIYFFLLGILTAGLRQATGMETVSFAILLMNLLIPLIDKIIINKPFGFTKTKKKSVKDN